MVARRREEVYEAESDEGRGDEQAEAGDSRHVEESAGGESAVTFVDEEA